MEIAGTDREDLKYAKMLLTEPGLATKMMNFIGVPFERGMKYLPEKWNSQILKVSQKALHSALKFSVGTIGGGGKRPSADTFHKFAAAASGGVGGIFGLPALGVDLTVSTILMLRSIADIARSEGEDLTDLQTRLACLEVFALGGPSESDDSAETSYYAIRTALSKSVSDAASFIAERGLAEGSAPILVRLINQIASRFGVAVSEKAAASAIPVVGAAGGSIINTLFMDHFQDMARGHFIVRRLERIYGKEQVKAEYDAI